MSLGWAPAWHRVQPWQARWRPCWMSLRRMPAQHRTHLQQWNSDFSGARTSHLDERHTISGTGQALPSRVKSSPPPSDASPPGPPEPGYSLSETPPLPDPGYLSTSLSEEANDRNNITKVGAPADADDTTVEADSTAMTVTEQDCGTSPWRLSRPG